MNFKPLEDKLVELEKAFGIRINFYVDHKDEFIGKNHLFGGYCAGARYLFLPYYLEVYGKVVISDVDGLIFAPIDTLWGGEAAAIRMSTNVFMQNRHTSGFLWEHILAGTFAIESTDVNVKFAQMNANYLAGQVYLCSQKGLKLFYTDQIGLLLTVVKMKGQCNFAKADTFFRQNGDWGFSGENDAKRMFNNQFDFKKGVDSISTH